METQNVTSKIKFINEKGRIKYESKRFCHKRSPLDCLNNLVFIKGASH